jgi:uncharacterized cupin superfamily protein
MCLASIEMDELLSIDVVDFSRASPDVSDSTPPAERLLAGNPVATAKNYFSDGEGRFFAGTWESTSGRWRVTYSEHEFCHITSGRVRIESASGKRWEFGPGASFVMPAGFSGTWEVLEPMSKLYVIYEPPPAP